MSSTTRVDPLSWVIRIDEAAPETHEPLHAWKQPKQFPVMRKVLHESVHFWHSVSTDFGIRLAFDCLKSMNALRIAAARGQDLTRIGEDWKLDGYSPFALLREAQSPSAEEGLSALQIFEGLARYWDRFIPTGLSFEELDQEMVDENELYGGAYRVAREQLAAFAPAFFPIVGYLSLCSERHHPAFLFVEALKRCARLIEAGKLSLDAAPFQIWRRVWQLSARGEVSPVRPNAPLTTFQLYMKRLTRWKSENIFSLSPGESWMGGHPILEPYANALFTALCDINPDLDSRTIVELIPYFAAVPGTLDNYRTLVMRMQPPLITFSDGTRWTNMPPHRKDIQTFTEGLTLFSDMMGAAISLVANAHGSTWRNACPCAACPVHTLNVCVGVLDYPTTFESCHFRTTVLRNEFHLRA